VETHWKEKEVTIGDIIVFRGEGFLFKVLSGILCLFDSEWRWRDFKGWHVGFISRFWDNHPIICEAVVGGVKENFLETDRDFKVYQWFDEPVDPHGFVNEHLGEKYDILVYPLTAIAYLIRHYLHRPVPRLFDNAWSCWELVYYFCNRMGKPLAESYDFPMISNMVKVLDDKEGL